MSAKLVLGISGNPTRPSKTRLFVDHIARHVAQGLGASFETFDIQDLGPSFGQARRPGELAARSEGDRRAAVGRDGPGRRLADVQGQLYRPVQAFLRSGRSAALRGKPVILTATGGGERHALIVEHQLRPLFGFFEALTMPTAIYASDKDFADGALVSDADPRSRPAGRERGLQFGRRTAARLASRPDPGLFPNRRLRERTPSFELGQGKQCRGRSDSAPSCPVADSISPPGGIPIRRPTAPPASTSTGSSRDRRARPVRRLFPRRRPGDRLRRRHRRRQRQGRRLRAGDAVRGAGAADRASRLHRHRLDHLRGALHDRAQVRLARPLVERPRRLERGDDRRRDGGAQLQPRRQHPHAFRYGRAHEHVDVVKGCGTASRTTPSFATRQTRRVLRHGQAPLHRPPRQAFQGARARSTSRARRRAIR